MTWPTRKYVRDVQCPQCNAAAGVDAYFTTKGVFVVECPYCGKIRRDPEDEEVGNEEDEVDYGSEEE